MKRVSMKSTARKIYWVVSTQFGVDLRRCIRSFRGIPRYIADLIKFKTMYRGRLNLQPCLFDWYEEGGATKNEYFLQDLHVARLVHRANPMTHVDVGSRVDGFVAHLASFRTVEIFDIRPITAELPGVVFRQADLMSESSTFVDYCDSLSCLHALEHFGLGRYGDPLASDGALTGLANMSRILRAEGTFYLSVPVGIERVEFNAHRVFDPLELVGAANRLDLELRDFYWIDSTQKLTRSSQPLVDMSQLSQREYSLGIFVFFKRKHSHSRPNVV